MYLYEVILWDGEDPIGSPLFVVQVPAENEIEAEKRAVLKANRQKDKEWYIANVKRILEVDGYQILLREKNKIVRKGKYIE